MIQRYIDKFKKNLTIKPTFVIKSIADEYDAANAPTFGSLSHLPQINFNGNLIVTEHFTGTDERRSNVINYTIRRLHTITHGNLQ